jgi:hypothetical protein
MVSKFSSLLGHVKPEKGEQIRARDQAEEFIAFHHDGNAAAIEHA